MDEFEEATNGISILDYIEQGDCLEQIPDESIDMVLTDPPYGISFKSNHRNVTYEGIHNDDDVSFLSDYFEQCHRIMRENTAIYCFCSWHHVDVFKQAFETFFKLKNIIIWEKNNTFMGDLKGSYAPKYEMILFGHKGRRCFQGFKYPDVLQAKRTGNKLHPTQKPLDLLELFIKSSSKQGEIVFDGFMGSGSTCVAAVNTGRHYIGFELDPVYFDIACKRLDEAEEKVWGD